MPIDSLEGVEPFLTHLDMVQRAAQLSAGSDVAVEKLVEETFRRAIAAHRNGDPRRPRELLLAELGNARQTGYDADTPATVVEQVVSDTQRSAATERARAVVHQVLSGLDSLDWRLLFLSEIDALSMDEIAALTAEPADVLEKRRQHVLTRIHESLFSESGPEQRVHLIDGLPDDWLKDSLSAISRQLPSASDGLRSRIAASAGPQVRTTQSTTSVDAPARAGASAPQKRRSPVRPMSILVGIALVLIVGFGADYLHSTLSEEPEQDLIVLAARKAGSFRFDLRTSSRDRGERFLQTHTGVQSSIPEIDGTTLGGVGIEEIAPGVHAPAARYVDDSTGASITLYALSYRFLDTHPSIRLSSDVRTQIQSESNFDIHSLRSAQVLVWRHRSSIYLAVTKIDGRELQSRISAPSD
jgi:DNA-directed RNA polymerase specialized sigma24 family protein